MKLLLVGFGRMGRLVEELAREDGHEVVARITAGSAASDWPAADVAIDFSAGDAVRATVARLAEQRTNVVIGTTGWAANEGEVRAIADKAGLGVVAAANFSIGVNIFQVLAAEAARLMQAQQDYGAWIHEAHHAAKKDAPSGTALMLRGAMADAGFGRPIDMSSTRAGSIPGTHTIGFDGPSDTIELTHTARDRRGFARGALVAAEWVKDRRGWFTMADVLREMGSGTISAARPRNGA
jgi:4-hydroxy-tetrahydrodipicolinate reductase